MLVLLGPNGQRIAIDKNGLAPPEPPPVGKREEVYERIARTVKHEQPAPCIDRGKK